MNRNNIFALTLAILLGAVWHIGVAGTTDKMQDTSIVEGNVWITEDGQRLFTCPVMGGEGLVTQAPSYSDLEGVRYYHCCAPCRGKFQSNPAKWMKHFAVPGNVVRVDEAGKHFVDPVDGSEGIVTDRVMSCDVDGKRYYFTSKRSEEVFRKHPQHYMRMMPEGMAE